VVIVSINSETETWRKWLATLRLVGYGPGEHVLTEGSKTGQLLILHSGAVAIVKAGTQIAAVSEPGAVFGEISALLDEPHTADVRTLESSQFYVASASSLLAQDSAALLYVTVALAQRLARANQALLELKMAIDAGEPAGLIEDAIGRVQKLLSAIGDGYVRAGAGLSIFPSG
jgi:CRP/FNR family transcriptional regulator, cyclic AMP receptor protein